MAYVDPVTGKKLLYWGSGFDPIKVQELASDRTSFAVGSKGSMEWVRKTMGETLAFQLLGF